MAFLADSCLDFGLNTLSTNGTAIYIISDSSSTWLTPTYTEATSTYALGSASVGGSLIAAPSDRGGGGREVVVSNVSNGNVTKTGTADKYAIVDSANSRLLAWGSLSSSQVVTASNSFTLTQFTIGIPDPA